jgi:bifunctional UDP-N-acetylglucosamine pyrophosphorylase / glucosamine-1-phosphate N-acetyltransferase
LSINNKNLTVIVLAAGKGKRMKSDIPKVLHNICYKPIIYHILTAAFKLNPKNLFVVIGHEAEKVEEFLGSNFPGAIPVIQEKQLGTAHAVSMLKSCIGQLGEMCLVMPGDIPLIGDSTLRKVVNTMKQSDNPAVVLTAVVGNPHGYGRVIKDDKNNILRIVEEPDASESEKKINEINSSIYCFETKSLFSYLENISSKNSQNEFYLTDIIENFVGAKQQVSCISLQDNFEIEGINDRNALAKLEKIMQSKINEKLMAEGVTIRDPGTCYISAEVEIGRDTVVEPFCFIKGKTKIGNGCVIGPFTQITDSIIGDCTKIYNSVIIGSIIGKANNIGPGSYLRPGTQTNENVKIGASCEIKKSVIRKNSKVPHLSYIGDADIGENVNIGAGTITCNFDGFFKNKTVIDDNVFIGSDTMLVAPVKIGKGAITAAGSVISENVPDSSLAIERNNQKNIENGALRFREKKEKQKKDTQGD